MVWFIENRTEVVAVIGGIVTAASIIVKMTPSDADNKVLAKTLSFLGAIALNPKDKK